MESLSRGAIEALVHGQSVPGPFIFQITAVKPIMSKSNNGGAPAAPMRYRLSVSDGQHFNNMMLSTQLSDLCGQGQLSVGTIIRVSDVITNATTGKTILIILSLEPIGFHEGNIGTPVLMENMSSNTQRPAALAGPAQPVPNASDNGSSGSVGPSYGQAPGPGPGYGAPQPHQGQGFVPVKPESAPMYGGAPTYGSQQPGMPVGGNNPGPGQGYGGGPAGGVYGGGGGPPEGGYGVGGGPAGGGGAGGGYGGGGAPPPRAAMGRPGEGGGGAGYGRPVPPPQYGSGGGAVSRNEAPARIMPIKSLNPFSGKWTIKAKCTSRAEMRRWTNVKGEGKLFSFDLLDIQGGEIRVTAFNDQAEKFYPIVEPGGIYLLSKASLKHKNPKFNSTNHDYEITLDRESVVEACPMDDEARAIPDVQFHFQPIADLGGVESGVMTDVIGVVERVDNWQTLTRKNGEEARKRALILRDNSGGSIELTLWGAAVNDPGDALYSMFQAGERPVLAIKSARVGEFNGKTLGTVSSSLVKVQPDIPEAVQLAAWYAGGGAGETVNALSSNGRGGMGGDRRCTFATIKDEELGHGEKADFIVVHATIIYVKSEAFPGYASCPGEFNGRACQKKLSEGGGQWYCERCSKYFTEPVWRYIVQVNAVDHTGSSWLTCFGDAGETLMEGTTAPDLKLLQDTDEPAYEKKIANANVNRMVFKLKVGEETYNDESRVKVSVSKMEHMDYVRESKATLDLIRQLEAGLPIFLPKGTEAGAAAGSSGANPFASRPGMQQQQPPQQQQQQQRWQGGTPGGAQGVGGGGGGNGYSSPVGGYQRGGGGPQMGGGGGPQMGGGGGGYGGPGAGPAGGSGGYNNNNNGNNGGYGGQQQPPMMGGGYGGQQQQPMMSGGPAAGGGSYCGAPAASGPGGMQGGGMGGAAYGGQGGTQGGFGQPQGGPVGYGGGGGGGGGFGGPSQMGGPMQGGGNFGGAPAGGYNGGGGQQDASNMYGGGGAAGGFGAPPPNSNSNLRQQQQQQQQPPPAQQQQQAPYW